MFQARSGRLAGTWNVLRMLRSNDAGRVGSLAHGSSEICSEPTTLSMFQADRSAGAWRVLRILLRIDDPLGGEAVPALIRPFCGTIV